LEKEELEILAQNHWSWVEGFQKSLGTQFSTASTKYLYKTAFLHGYKHAIEELEKEKE